MSRYAGVAALLTAALADVRYQPERSNPCIYMCSIVSGLAFSPDTKATKERYYNLWEDINIYNNISLVAHLHREGGIIPKPIKDIDSTLWVRIGRAFWSAVRDYLIDHEHVSVWDIDALREAGYGAVRKLFETMNGELNEQVKEHYINGTTRPIAECVSAVR